MQWNLLKALLLENGRQGERKAGSGEEGRKETRINEMPTLLTVAKGVKQKLVLPFVYPRMMCLTIVKL